MSELKTINAVNRRDFLKLTGLSGASFALATALSTSRPVWAIEQSANESRFNLFVSIDADSTVNIVCHRSEMGQGIRTGVPQVIADELCADWSKVNVVQGLANEEYGSQNTDGSRSIRRNYTRLRQLGAAARTMLEQAAAKVWQVPVEQVYAENNFIVHKTSGKKLAFGYLAELASKIAPPKPESLVLKDEKDFTLIGKPVSHIDFPDVVTGNTVFGQDIQLEGMLVASIERSPVVGAKVDSFNKEAALAVSGVVDVLQMPEQPMPVVFHPLNGVAVIADHTWAAMQGRKALAIKWQASANDSHDSHGFLADLNGKIVAKGKVIRTKGDVYHALENANKTHAATYTVPYLAHAPMEPPAATAVVTDDSCEVWACTQTPQSTQQNVAAALGLDKSQVKVNVTLLGGGFGRKSKPDFSVEAALLAKHMGKPVKVVWSREDDIRNGYYHAVSAQHMLVAMDDANQVTAWVQRTAFPSISWTFNGTADEPSEGELSLGFGDVPVDVPNLSCETHKATGHMRIGWVRSVSNIHHAFALGSFVDELAVVSGVSTHKMWLQLLGKDRLVDPVAEGFKYRNYGDSAEQYPIDTKRLKAVLNDVVTKSGADKSVGAGEGWGISVHRSFVSYVAVATKVKVVDNKVTVLEMHTTIDAGTVVNTDRVHSQQEGSMIFGLSLALMGEISIKGGAVTQSNYHDYPVLRMHQSPVIKSYIMPSNALPGGVGEPGTPPVAASLTNAIYRASGKRIRNLPVSKHMQI